ncbi:MAG: GNAT family N-acetyltransferase [Candidatus Micrarchaeota archaeon]|nr:GNAT family N-acetyltransferase [Candidatus Micrarchaeota archaeon]
MENVKNLKGANEKEAAAVVARSTGYDIPKILELVDAEAKGSGAVLEINANELTKWIGKGNSFVASVNDQIIGHSAIDIWPESGWAELRASVVKSEFRGHGVYTKLTKVRIQKLLVENPDVTIVVLKNKESSGSGILDSLGFKTIPKPEAPKELFSIGGDQEWKIFVAAKKDINEKLLRS